MVDILRDNAEIYSRLPRAFADASGQLSYALERRAIDTSL